MKYLVPVLILLAFIAGCRFGNHTEIIPARVVHDTVHDIDSIPYPVAVSARAVYIPYKDSVKGSFSDSIIPTPVTVSPSDCDSIRDYLTYSHDSLVKVKSTVHGTLLSQVIDAKIVNTTVEVPHYMGASKSYDLYAGMTVGLNYIAPSLTLSRSKSYVSVGYDVLSKTPTVGYGVRLWGR